MRERECVCKRMEAAWNAGVLSRRDTISKADSRAKYEEKSLINIGLINVLFLSCGCENILCRFLLPTT